MKISLASSILSIFSILFMATSIQAACLHNGKTYQEGEKRQDGRVCYFDGTWR